jgi:hypothetical protein
LFRPSQTLQGIVVQLLRAMRVEVSMIVVMMMRREETGKESRVM